MQRFPAFHGQNRHEGWFAGGGLEYMVHKGALVDVIFGAEYQHFDVQERNTFCFNPSCSPANAEDYRSSATGDIVRARLTIKTQGYGLVGTVVVTRKYRSADTSCAKAPGKHPGPFRCAHAIANRIATGTAT